LNGCIASLQQKHCASESRRLKFSDENADRIPSYQQRDGWLYNLSERISTAAEALRITTGDGGGSALIVADLAFIR
jgi:hypothetical protein